MTRGNQREKDRERASARNAAKGKTKDDGLTPEQRRERWISQLQEKGLEPFRGAYEIWSGDAKALQEKAAKKAAQAAASGNTGGKSTK